MKTKNVLFLTFLLSTVISLPSLSMAFQNSEEQIVLLDIGEEEENKNEETQKELEISQVKVLDNIANLSKIILKKLAINTLEKKYALNFCTITTPPPKVV